MKIIYNINKFWLITTFVLYLTIIFGLYAQIALGAIQVLSSIVSIYYWKKLSAKLKEKFYIYWTIVTTYGVWWFSGIDKIDTGFWFVAVIAIPMCIAIYFVLILKQSKSYIS